MLFDTSKMIARIKKQRSIKRSAGNVVLFDNIMGLIGCAYSAIHTSGISFWAFIIGFVAFMPTVIITARLQIHEYKVLKSIEQMGKIEQMMMDMMKGKPIN